MRGDMPTTLSFDDEVLCLFISLCDVLYMTKRDSLLAGHILWNQKQFCEGYIP